MNPYLQETGIGWLEPRVMRPLPDLRAAGFEAKNTPCQKHTGRAASHLLQRIDPRAVAIRRQRLQDLEKCCPAENNAADKGAPRIGEVKERSDNRKRGPVFNMSKGLHFGEHQKWREPMIDRVNEADVSQRCARNEDD